MIYNFELRFSFEGILIDIKGLTGESSELKEVKKASRDDFRFVPSFDVNLIPIISRGKKTLEDAGKLNAYFI